MIYSAISRRLSKLRQNLFSVCASMSANKLETPVCIVGSGPAAHTAAIYCARAELQPILFEGWLANGIAAGGQLTTTTDVENFPGFPEGIMGGEITEKFRYSPSLCNFARYRRFCARPLLTRRSHFAQKIESFCCRAQSERFGTQIFAETVTKIDLSRKPFRIFTDEKEVEATTVIVATGEPRCIHMHAKNATSWPPSGRQLQNKSIGNTQALLSNIV